MSNQRIQTSPADAVTVANAICGFLAIAVVARAWTGNPEPGGGLPDGDLVIAATLIVAGAALDSVDGIVARRFGGSPLGEHLEVMSDVVTFGLAPAVLFAVEGASHDSPWDALALAAGAAYVVAALLRLARYVVASSAGGGHELVGFPTPPAAMAMVAIVGLDADPALALALVVTVSVLMIGTFRFPVMSGFVGRFIGTWFVLSLIAIFTLPHWVPAAATLIMFAAAFVLIRQHRLT